MAALAHIVIPLISMFLSMGGTWPLIIAGASIELGDAALYYFVDKDPYLAGLSVIFAFAGPLDHFLAPLLSTTCKGVLRKLATKTIMTEEEVGVVGYTLANSRKLTRLTRFGMARQILKQFIIKAKNASMIVRFILWLSSRGFGFFGKMTILIGGSFMTWDFIAQKLGLCKSLNLADLKQSDWKILKLLGMGGQYFQPFTLPCNTDEVANALGEYDKDLQRKRISLTLGSLIKNNSVFSEQLMSKNKLPETYVIQCVLKYFGFSHFTPNKIEKEIEKDSKKLLSKEKCEAILFSMDLEKLSQHPECNSYLKPNKKISKKTENILNLPDKSTKKKYSYGDIDIIFKWGFYDENTTNMIKEFQKKYNLFVDGIAGKQVFEKMKKLVDGIPKNKKMPEYFEFDWSEKELKKLRDDFKEYLKRKFPEGINVTPEEINDAIMNQKQQIVDSTDMHLNSIDDSMWDDDNELEEIATQADSLIKQN
jgi:peptidoglycan hydrolase-like protein with peptidoglycan-binding domain